MNTYAQVKLYKNNVKYINIDMLRHIFPLEWYTQQIQNLGSCVEFPIEFIRWLD